MELTGEIGGSFDHNTKYDNDENELRSRLRFRLQKLTNNEPLDPTYKHLFLQSVSSVASTSGMLPKDSLYKDIKSTLRQKVETFVANGGLDIAKVRGRDRNSLNFNLKDDGSTKNNDNKKDPNNNNTAAAMRAAFTLRESMRHDQECFVSSYLAAEKRQIGVYQAEAKRQKLESLVRILTEPERRVKERALDLKNSVEREKKEKLRLRYQEKMKNVTSSATDGNLNSSNSDSKGESGLSKMRKIEESLRRKSEESRKKLEQKERENDEKERMRQIEKQKERERQREASRKREEEQMRRDEEQKHLEERMAETPKEATHRLYYPIFKELWDMEFSNLGGTNPFRIVIDKDNCVAMGVPDYADVIEHPMNLTYIQEKVNHKTYETLQSFIDDVKLLINNALLYNSDPNNEYHIAAKKLKRKFKKTVTNVLKKIEQKQMDLNAT